MDKFDKKKRSQIMSLVKSEDTRPEMIVRRFLHKNGFRYRLHDKRFPSKPDLVFPKYKTVLFIHGCFWHGHDGCFKARLPKSNIEFWKNKIQNNKARDANAVLKIKAMGWRVIIFWQCILKQTNALLTLAADIKNE